MTSNKSSIRVLPILLISIFGLALIICSYCLDPNSLSSILLEIGAGFCLVGVFYWLEQRFFQKVKRANEETVELIEDIVESAAETDTTDEFKIEITPTSIKDGREPKILIRITDPEANYKTKWIVTLTYPDNKVKTEKAFWPSSGKTFRARFPTSENRKGTWKVLAVRNGKDEFNSQANII